MTDLVDSERRALLPAATDEVTSQVHDEEPLLQVSDLSVTLEGQVALEKLSFTVKQREVLTILGPNGAGKTVLLHALLETLPHKGSIIWKKGTRIGYVPQRLPYIRDIPLTVQDFFALKRGAGTDVDGMLHAVGLGAKVGKKLIGDLSSGQFQRVLIAWALAGYLMSFCSTSPLPVSIEAARRPSMRSSPNFITSET